MFWQAAIVADKMCADSNVSPLPKKKRKFVMLASGKYDGAADGDWENCVRSQGT